MSRRILKKLSGILGLLFVAPIFFIAAAAQPGKGKAAKAPPAVKEDPGPWLLAGREGGCAPTSILARKGPEYSDIRSPYQLVEKLRAAGHPVEIKEYDTDTRPAVAVTAPTAGLAVMFVKKEFCDKVAAGSDKK